MKLELTLHEILELAKNHISDKIDAVSIKGFDDSTIGDSKLYELKTVIKEFHDNGVDKINCVKNVRTISMCSLKEAKDFVELPLISALKEIDKYGVKAPQRKG